MTTTEFWDKLSLEVREYLSLRYFKTTRCLLTPENIEHICIEEIKYFGSNKQQMNNNKPKNIVKINLPNGEYFANCIFYNIYIQLPEWKNTAIKINKGIRGFAENIVVEVIDGYVYVNE